MSLTRRQLQAMAEAKLDDAQLLLGNGRSSNAYYLAGYAVELSLKSVIARRFQAEEIPDRNLVNSVYTHDLAALARLADLQPDLEDVRRMANWLIVSQWSERSRYETTGVEEASRLLTAIADPDAGVFPWLRRYW